jgi:hypothetical protein
MLDPVQNLVKITTIGLYGAGDTAVQISSDDAAKLPAGAYNVTWYNATDYGDPCDDPNAEIVRITAPGTTLTIQRAAEQATGGGAASTKNTPNKVYRMILGITAKMMADIASNLQKPWRLVNLDGAIDGVNTVFALHGSVTPFDANSLDVKLARQPQEQGIDYTFSGVTVTYIVPPDASLSGMPHTAKYQ